MPNMIRSFQVHAGRSRAARAILPICAAIVLIFIVDIPLQLTSAQQPSQTSKRSPAKPAEETPLEPVRIIDRKLSGGQSHSFQLSVAAGQFTRVVVEQRGIDVVVALYDSSGKKLVELD